MIACISEILYIFRDVFADFEKKYPEMRLGQGL